MSGVLTDLSVAGKLAMRATGRRFRSEISPAPDLDLFSDGMQDMLERAAPGPIADTKWLTMSAKQPPWLTSGMMLSEGQEVSYFLAGRVYANKPLDVWVEPIAQIWCKIGQQGEIFRGTRRAHSFATAQSGELQFGNYFPNDWADLQGARQDSDDVYRTVSGEVRLLVVRWSGKAIDGLKALKAAGDFDGRVQEEIERLEAGSTTPEGWNYLWNLGPAEIYKQQHTDDGRPCIHCHTHKDVGILQREVDLPLDASSEISWRWCVDQLPSTLREDSMPTHDYLSIAIEFDNGRDITYYWSTNLPVGRGFKCPLPNWNEREFHVVVRSGEQQLGEWLDERRNIFEDYQHYMGEPPARIVKVWLIANSVFQRETGNCQYSDIVFHHKDTDIKVL